MIVIRELIYFMFALFLLVVLMCLVIWCGWLLNTLCKELLDVDVISIMRMRRNEKRFLKDLKPPMNFKKEKE